MRVAFVTKNAQALPGVEASFLALGFVVSDQPDFVIALGGDGTLLRAERAYPGIPKALLRDSKVGNLSLQATADELALAIRDKRFVTRECDCLEAEVHGVTYRAANDVIVRNARLTQAIRFELQVNGVVLPGEFIGDGLVVATPLGSGAYYNTLTRSVFSSGFGVAFNNIHNKNQPPLLLAQCDLVIRVLRGPANLGVDNSDHVLELADGDEVVVRQSLTPLRLISLRP
jgi:NAD+ kinase